MKKATNLMILFFVSTIFMNCTATKGLKQAEANRETIRMWFEEGWNHNRNYELIERVFHPEWTDGNPLNPGQTIGHEGMRELVKFYKDSFPDAQFTITHIFADATHAAIRYEVEATHYGDAFGLKATGKKFSSTGLVIYEMRDGRIYRSWQELDLMGIINQLRE